MVRNGKTTRILQMLLLLESHHVQTNEIFFFSICSLCIQLITNTLNSALNYLSLELLTDREITNSKIISNTGGGQGLCIYRHLLHTSCGSLVMMETCLFVVFRKILPGITLNHSLIIIIVANKCSVN